VTVGSERHDVARGDLFAVPPGVPVTFCTDRGLDAFRFSDEPVVPVRRCWRCAASSPSAPTRADRCRLERREQAAGSGRRRPDHDAGRHTESCSQVIRRLPSDAEVSAH